MSTLSGQLPRASLGFWPTPLVPLPRLTAALGGPRLWMKRDDHTGLALGGNKTRKLEWLLGDALKQGCDVVVTAGAAQSNHCRQSAAAAAQLGLECHLALGGQAPTSWTGNLLLDALFGATVHWSGQDRTGRALPALEATLRRQGRRPALIPYGGSNWLGAAAFVHAHHELMTQTRQAGLNLGAVVFASSSGGTHAGLALAAHLCDAEHTIIGVAIDKDMGDAERHFTDRVDALATQTARRLAEVGEIDQSDARRWAQRGQITLWGGYQSAGYGVIGPQEREAISLVARHEGILLDPVYTGRAMAGLIDQIRAGALSDDRDVVFWHTGGAPALFHHADHLLSG